MAQPIAVGLVRKADGTPRIDGDPTKLPPELIAMLTDEDKVHLGLASPKPKGD